MKKKASNILKATAAVGVIVCASILDALTTPRVKVTYSSKDHGRALRDEHRKYQNYHNHQCENCVDGYEKAKISAFLDAAMDVSFDSDRFALAKEIAAVGKYSDSLAAKTDAVRALEDISYECDFDSTKRNIVKLVCDI